MRASLSRLFVLKTYRQNTNKHGKILGVVTQTSLSRLFVLKRTNKTQTNTKRPSVLLRRPRFQDCLHKKKYKQNTGRPSVLLCRPQVQDCTENVQTEHRQTLKVLQCCHAGLAFKTVCTKTYKQNTNKHWKTFGVAMQTSLSRRSWQHPEYTTWQQRPESPTVTSTWHASKYKAHKLQRTCLDSSESFFVLGCACKLRQSVPWVLVFVYGLALSSHSSQGKFLSFHATQQGCKKKWRTQCLFVLFCSVL